MGLAGARKMGGSATREPDLIYVVREGGAMNLCGQGGGATSASPCSLHPISSPVPLFTSLNHAKNHANYELQ